VRGKQAAIEELDQLHKWNCFNPVDVSSMTRSEKNRAMQSLLFLTGKRDGRIKGRLVYNGKSNQRLVVQGGSCITNFFIRGNSPHINRGCEGEPRCHVRRYTQRFYSSASTATEDGDERVIMKITGVLVDLLVSIDPTKYGPFVVTEKGTKTLYVQVVRALYGMLVASLVWYRQFKLDLETVGFHFNPYDPCIANRKVNGSTHTIKFHVDDLMSSHKDPKVNDNFLSWLNNKYGGHGEVKATRGINMTTWG
jgi:hypothetical protein